jgi:glycosyltransferase involved in cell wall biosynthesis
LTYPASRIKSMSVSFRLLLAAIRRRRTAAVVHVHSYHATAAMAALGSRTPIVFTPHYHGKHGHSLAANILHPMFYPIGKLVLRSCNAVICVSEAERELLVGDFPFIADRVTVIPNGANIHAIRAARPYPGEPPTVLCVGRLEPYKRFAAVLTEFALVSPPAQLVIVGDGSQRLELQRLSTELGITDRVKLTGLVTDAELHRWLRTAQVLVSMSEREAFGMAPVEAAAAGARVVLSDIPAHREIVADYLGDSACVVPDYAPSGLAEAIQRQLDNPYSAVPPIPDWSDVAARTEAVYRSVASQTSRRCTKTVSYKGITGK